LPFYIFTLQLLRTLGGH